MLIPRGGEALNWAFPRLPYFQVHQMSTSNGKNQKLKPLFQAWEAIENVFSLDRDSCKRFIDFLSIKANSSYVVDEPKNSIRFAEEFDLKENSVADITGLITNKIYELKAHLAKLAPELHVDVGAGWKSVDAAAQQAFSSYLKAPRKQRTFNLHQSVFVNLCSQGRNQALGLHLRLIRHGQHAASLFTPT